MPTDSCLAPYSSPGPSAPAAPPRSQPSPADARQPPLPQSSTLSPCCLKSSTLSPCCLRAVPSPPAAPNTPHRHLSPRCCPQCCLPPPTAAFLPAAQPHLGPQRCPRHAAQLLPVSRRVCDVLLERVQELLECQVMPTCEASFKSALMGGRGCGNRARGLGAAGRSLRMHGARLSLRVWRWREMQGPGATVPHSAPRHPPTFSSAFLASS